MKAFDQKFGAGYFSSLPTTPGIYKIFDAKGALIYVGKAKNLRRRLGQYRNAKRRKKHAKMRKIVGEAASIQYELHPTDHAACLAEIQVIQEQRPKFNRAGAFSFLYPLVGIAHESRELTLVYTTEPAILEADLVKRLSLHGAYRSRHLAGNAFFALVDLLAYVGHPNKPQKIGKYSYLYSFRQVDDCWPKDLDAFFRGDSPDLLENLILALIERPSTRRRASEIQDLLNDLKRFLRFEAKALARMRKALGTGYPISQKERDVLLLDYQYRRERQASATALALTEA